MSNYDGLTRNTWTGTWSPSGTHPIVLDTEIRGGLRFVSGEEGDRLENISGQRLQEGMLVYLKTGYDSFSGDKYYKYLSLDGESRNGSTGELPNSNSNWSEVLFGSNSDGGSGSTNLGAGTGLEISNSKISLKDTGVTPGTYGSSLEIPILTVDSQGRVTSVSSAAIQQDNGPISVGGGSGNSSSIPIQTINSQSLGLVGSSASIDFSEHDIDTIVSYIAKDFNGAAVSVDATITNSGINFQTKGELLDNVSIDISYISSFYGSETVSYKYPLSGLQHFVQQDSTDRIINYFILGPGNNIVESQIEILSSGIDVISNFDMENHFLYVISKKSYKYIMSGNSYSLRHNGINNLINFYALDPNGNVVDLGVNVSDSDLTVESNYSLDGHSLYVITN